jgi:hypothetical protein
MALVPDFFLIDDEFAIEDLSTGVHASGFGMLAGGRSFSFHVAERQALVVEVYRPRRSGLVPHEEDVVATASRSVIDIDLSDERSLVAAVRDAISGAEPVERNAR